MTKISASRIFEKLLSVYLAPLAILGSYNVILAYEQVDWLRLLEFTMVILGMLITSFHLWKGAQIGYELAQFLYALQIPSVIGFGSAAYVFDGGIKLSAGWLNDRMLFSARFYELDFRFGHTDSNFQISGLMINFAAIALTIYFSMRRDRI